MREIQFECLVRIEQEHEHAGFFGSRRRIEDDFPIWPESAFLLNAFRTAVEIVMAAYEEIVVQGIEQIVDDLVNRFGHQAHSPVVLA